MSTTTNSTSSSEDTTNSKKYEKFLSDLLYSLIKIVILIIVGCVFLYITKITQSNILTVIIDILNNTEKTKKDELKTVDVNITKHYEGFLGKFGIGSKPTVFKTTVNFSNGDNQSIEHIKNMFTSFTDKVFKLDKQYSMDDYTKLFNEQNQNNKGNEKPPTINGSYQFMLWYFYNVIKSSIGSTLWLLNIVFSFLGSNITESILLILFSYFGVTFFIIFLLFILCIVSIYSLINIPKIYDSLVLKKENNDLKRVFLSDANNYFKILPALFLFFLFLMGFGVVFFLSILVLCFVLYICLSTKGIINNYSDKIFNFSYFLTSTLKYKSQVIMIIFSYYLYLDIIQNLSSNYIISFVLAILIFLLYTTFFQSFNEANIANDVNFKLKTSTPSSSTIPIPNMKPNKKIKIDGGGGGTTNHKIKTKEYY